MTALGVGFIGAGPVTQAIHLPTLASLDGAFTVAHVMDVDEALARRVADQAGARSSADHRQVLDDPQVDVVAVCSPPQFHAEQVVQACAAGKRAVLCEKPMATSAEEAGRIAKAATASGVPVLVGTMHAYDPAWRAAREAWGPLPRTASLVRSVIYLPPNDEFIGLATQLAAPAAPLPRRGDLSDPEVQAAMLRGAILGLAIHNTPLIRELLPAIDAVTDARPFTPFGYRLTFRSGDRAAHLISLMPGAWSPRWAFDAWSADQHLEVTFPPSYVLAGSAAAVLAGPGPARRWESARNGYQAEWEHLADIVAGRAEPLISVDDSAADLRYALDLADGARGIILGDPT
jgi:myo-inositol 2-dehydrogenase / D-chiro-inositol 1-dehydrogenase